MPVFDLVDKFDPVLKQECAPFNFETGVTLEDGKTLNGQELFEILRDSMVAHRGLGLSACQIGIPTRVFVIGNPDEPDSIIPVFNPTIVHASDEVVTTQEGCLSFPGLFIDIKRPASIRARFANAQGTVDSANFSGLTATVFQHEFDHLYGTVFTKRAHWKDLDKAYMQQKKLNRARKRNVKDIQRTVS